MKKYINVWLLSMVCMFMVVSGWAKPEKPTLLPTCDVDNPCPTGLICVDHSCVMPGTIPDENDEPNPGQNEEPTPGQNEQPNEQVGEETTPCSSVPVLKHFTVTDSSCAFNEIYFELTPNTENPPFHLHMLLSGQGDRDELSTWCTGDETFCKLIGNGQNCVNSSSDGNTWCYKPD